MEPLQQFTSSDVSSTPSSRKKPWEHPWTVEEMKKGSEHWNLASDVGLLLYLQEFSQKLLKQTHEIQEQVDGLNHDTKLTNIRLHNVFNDFVMLANTQFMENRVYDEEVVVQEQTNGNKKAEEKEKTQQEKEMELVPKIKQAISFGLNVFDTAYEKLDMNIANSESEDEDGSAAKTNIILEPKDPYLLRPLPFLIGSEQFFQSDSLGLSSLLVDESEDQDSDPQSDVEHVGPREIPPSVKPEARVDTSCSESDEDLFTVSKAEYGVKKTKDDEEEEEEEERSAEITFGDKEITVAKNPMSDLQSELSRKFGEPAAVSAKRQGSVDREEVPSAKPRSSKITQQPTGGGGGLFDAAVEEPSDDIFSRPSRLFSSRPTLFDDEDDDSGGLFIAKKTSQPKEDQKIPPKTTDPSKSLSSDSDTRTTSTSQSRGQEIKETKQPKEEKSFFDEADDDDDDGDLFATKPVPAARQTKETKKPGVSLFVDDDDEDNDHSDIFGKRDQSSPQVIDKSARVQNKPKIPAGAVSIFGGGDNLFKAALLKSKKDDDMDDDVGISNKSLSKPSTLAKSSRTIGSTDALRPSPGSSSPSTVSSSSLFAEDPELFALPPKSKPTVDLNKVQSQTKAKSGLGLFSADDEEDDDLFATMSKPLPSTSTKTSANEPQPIKKATKFLFDDDDDDEGDLFSFQKASTKDEKKNLKLIVEAVPRKAQPDVPEEPKPKELPKEQAKEVPKPRATKVSLFSSSDEEDDFFGASRKKSPEKLKTPEKSPGLAVTKPAANGRSLFDDDDFLFGENSDNGPSVDLFKSPAAEKIETSNSSKTASNISASSPVKSSATTSTVPIQEPATSKTKLFDSIDDDDDDDDLFSTLKTKPSDKSKVMSKALNETITAKQTDIKVDAEIKQKDSLEDLFGNKTATNKKTSPEIPSAQNTKTIASKLIDDPLNLATAATGETKSKAAEPTIASNDPLAPHDEFSNQTVEAKEVSASTIKEKQSPKPKSPTSPKPFPKVSTKTSKISQLQASINIDPTAHLPQMNKKKDEAVESVAVDFDLPPQGAKLQNLAKDRAKIPIKRRPPTRKHAEPQDQNDGFHHEPLEQDPVSESNSTVQKTEHPVSHPRENNLISQGESIFQTQNSPPENHNSDDDLFGSSLKRNPVPSKISANDITEHKLNQASTGDNKNIPDLNSAVKAEEKKSSRASSKPTSSKYLAAGDDFDDDDLFGSIAKPRKFISAEQSAKPNKIVGSAAIAIEDDLLGQSDFLSSSKTTAMPQKEKVAPSSGQLETQSSVKPKKVIDDDDDDLFGENVSSTYSKTSIPEAKIEVRGRQIANSKEEIVPKMAEQRVLSDEDDIITGPNKEISASVKVTSKAAASAVTKDDDDDIFASSSLVPKASSQPAKAKPQVQSPFGDDDDDDIFANIPTASSKAKTPTGQGQQKKGQISDEDDLFGPSSRSAASSRPAYKKPVTKDEDLFRDDTDIFADIPSSKSKEKKSQNVKAATAVAFADESEDIFADAALMKPKQILSEAQKPPVTSQPKDDYDDIFEDPLNALRK